MKKEKLDILYEDKFLIIVNKKSGILTIANDKEKEKTLYHEVHEYLWRKNKNNKVFIIHRLDKDTSGIVIFAKNDKIKKIMQDNWGSVQRYYYALCHGNFKCKSGTIINYLKETKTFMVYDTKNEKIGDKSITKYEVIDNENNKTLEDCANSTMIRVNELNYLRSPEYKEKMLLEKITNIYEKVKGKLTKEEILYSGDFINLIREVYSLPNNRTITREKIVKNGGKDSVIIVATDSNGNYILTFQTRINDKIIAEFPSGYIENGEDVIEAAKRELKEETGYVSDNVTILDNSYYSVGIDNSICYVVRIKNSIKAFNVNPNENLTYGIFTEEELKYLLNNNIMCGGLNKLAYYSLQNKGCKRTLRNVK